MSTPIRVDPRVRAYGKARIDVTRRARDEQEWQSMWHEPRYPFPFTWGDGWRHCIQYTVDDFAAEIGFFIDVLGFQVLEFSPTFARFVAPDGEFSIAVSEAIEGGQSLPPEAIRLQFMLEGLADTITELQRRGVQFEDLPDASGDSPAVALLRSPHGLLLELWGITETPTPLQSLGEPTQSSPVDEFWADDEEDGEDGDENVPSEPTGGTAAALDEELAVEDLVQDEPVYVDEEIDEEVEPQLAQAPEPLPKPRPAFPTAVIRRTEDLLKGGLSKRKGNGNRTYPNLEDGDGSP